MTPFTEYQDIIEEYIHHSHDGCRETDDFGIGQPDI